MTLEAVIGSMPDYRCYFLNTANPFSGTSTSIDGVEDFSAKSDDKARAKAETLYGRRRNQLHGYEVWEGNRLILVSAGAKIPQ